MAEQVPETLEVADLDPTFAEEVASQPGGEFVRRCFACGTCVAGCPVSEVEPRYSPRKIVRQILFGCREEVLSSPLIWYCMVCYRCYARCPQGVNFTDVMRALRHLSVKGHHTPPDLPDRLQEIERDIQKKRCERIREEFENVSAQAATEGAAAEPKT